MDSRSENMVRLVPSFLWGFLSIVATIRIWREIQCLPYAGFFLLNNCKSEKCKLYSSMPMPFVCLVCNETRSQKPLMY